MFEALGYVTVQIAILALISAILGWLLGWFMGRASRRRAVAAAYGASARSNPEIPQRASVPDEAIPANFTTPANTVQPPANPVPAAPAPRPADQKTGYPAPTTPPPIFRQASPSADDAIEVAAPSPDSADLSPDLTSNFRQDQGAPSGWDAPPMTPVDLSYESQPSTASPTESEQTQSEGDSWANQPATDLTLDDVSEAVGVQSTDEHESTVISANQQEFSLMQFSEFSRPAADDPANEEPIEPPEVVDIDEPEDVDLEYGFEIEQNWESADAADAEVSDEAPAQPGESISDEPLSADVSEDPADQDATELASRPDDMALANQEPHQAFDPQPGELDAIPGPLDEADATVLSEADPDTTVLAPPAEPDTDSTVLAPPAEPDTDSTVLAPPAEPDTDSTVLAPPAEPDTDSTVLAPPAEPDTDSTVLAPPAEPDTDSTVLAPPAEPDTDSTVLAPPAEPDTDSTVLAPPAEPDTDSTVLAPALEAEAGDELGLDGLDQDVTVLAEAGDDNTVLAPAADLATWAPADAELTDDANETGESTVIAPPPLPEESTVMAPPPPEVDSTIFAPPVDLAAWAPNSDLVDEPVSEPAEDSSPALKSAEAQLAQQSARVTELQRELLNKEQQLNRLEAGATAAWDTTVPKLEDRIAVLAEVNQQLETQLRQISESRDTDNIEMNRLRLTLAEQEQRLTDLSDGGQDD